MGACQTVGGAATSGHGLTGRQVAGALTATAAVQLKSHRDRLKAEEDPNFSRKRTMSGVTQSLDDIGEEKYKEKRELEFEVPNSKGVMEKVTVQEYSPEVFRFLRQLDGIDEDMFADEWTLPEDRLSLELGEGRSMALFLKSKSMNLMCKTIAEEEVNVLLSFLPQYADHLSRNPNALLMRFSMLLRIETSTDVGFILSFGDVFASCHMLNEKWDLKGRMPKPGKYKHFPRLIKRPCEPTPYIIETPRDLIEVPESLGMREMVLVVEAADKDKLVTQKDKNLTRLFWLELQRRSKLLDALLKDYAFLGKVGLMDYSLLIGVTYNERKLSRSGKRIRSMRMTHEMGRECDAGVSEIRPTAKGRERNKFHEFSTGIYSLYDQEVYYVGVIDILTRYTWKKKVANFCKSFLWKDDTLSTVPPAAYCKRISKYTKIIFPAVNMSGTTT